MSKPTVEIDECLYQRSQARATQEGKTLTTVIEAYLRSWLSPEPESEGTITRIRDTKYVVRPGDTLALIALRMYSDAKHYTLIAAYNDITDPEVIHIGQSLRIPYTEVVPVSQLGAGKRFRFPLDKTETDYYKFGSLYASHSPWAGKPHPGVDFHEYKGANVYAVGEGIVLVNRQDPTGYGHYIMIEHTLTTGEEVYSLYAHLQHDNVSFTSPPVGTEIKGQDVVIGKEGESGCAGIPHLHFEIKKTADLGLYPMLNTYNLHGHFHDPHIFILDPNNLYVPVDRASSEVEDQPQLSTPPTDGTG